MLPLQFTLFWLRWHSFRTLLVVQFQCCSFQQDVPYNKFSINLNFQHFLLISWIIVTDYCWQSWLWQPIRNRDESYNKFGQFESFEAGNQLESVLKVWVINVFSITQQFGRDDNFNIFNIRESEVQWIVFGRFGHILQHGYRKIADVHVDKKEERIDILNRQRNEPGLTLSHRQSIQMQRLVH